MRVQIKRLQLNKMDYHFFLSPRDRFRNGGGVVWGGVLTMIPKTQPFFFSTLHLSNLGNILNRDHLEFSKLIEFAGIDKELR